MSGTGTNDFVINNLDKLSTRYKLWHIKGLNRATERERNRNEYYQNRQYIINKLSFRLQQPVTIIEREETPYLVVPEEVMRMPTSLPLLRGRKAFFEPLPEIFELDYTKRSPENDTICLRFLEFRLQTPLHSHLELWQSKSGAPFFTRKVEGPDRPIIHYTGFAVRPVIAPDGGLALRVHIANKYVSREPLPTLLSHNDAWQWKRKHFIYHYGYLWYEINPTSLSDLNVSQYPVFTNDGVELPLLELAIRESKKPIPPELSLVEHNSAVLIYYNNRDEERSAISSLCYRVFGPHDAETKKLHRYSILPPGARRGMAMDFARRYLSRLKFGETSLEVDTEPISVPTRIFTMPDIRFGNAQVLSVRGTTGAHQTTLTELGAMRLNLLKDKKAGFYDARQLGRQYFIVPLSVYQSWGGSFLQGIGNAVDHFLHREDAYQPIIVPYNDLCPHTFLEQAKAILKVVGEQCDKPGHVLVMIHHLQSRKNHEEDPLAAMVVRELRSRFGLAAAVMHTAVGQECYVLGANKAGEPAYVPHPRQRGKLAGYLQMVAINKVLLLNERWPFILATPLHADLIIGIDVKHHTAGFILVDRYGERIRSLLKNSAQKERLRDDQTESYLLELVRAEVEAQRGQHLQHLVIHRDGRIWPSEIAGIQRAFKRLQRQRMLSDDATLTILEIPKTSPCYFRLFAVSENGNGIRVENPQIGQWEVRGHDGYICSTGRAFPRPGTTQPLHVRKIDGPMPMEECQEDLFYLCALAWTKPDDCVRDPMTTKLNDRFLSDEATTYDAEGLEYSLSSEEHPEEEEEASA